MRLCRGCQTKIPDDTKGMCAACERERYGTKTGDGIKSHGPAQSAAGKTHTMAGYDAEIEPLRKCKRWNDRRAQAIKRDGSCVRCKTEGRPPAPIEIIDHVIPAQIAIAQVQESKRFPFDKYAGYYLLCNLAGLCRSCHAVKTLEDLSHAGPWPNVMDAYDAQPKKQYFF